MLDLITERDNRTLDPVRLFGIGFAFVTSNTLLALTIFSVVVMRSPFDPEQFAKALGLLWAVVSVAITCKALTEKQC